MAKRTPYQILGISKDTTDGVAKIAFHKLAMRYHPDRNIGDKKAEAIFKAISAAWEEVRDALPKDPVPLVIPPNASEAEVEEIIAQWLLDPRNAAPTKQ